MQSKNENEHLCTWSECITPHAPKANFHLQKSFRGQERNRKAHGHARGSREQENSLFRSVPRIVQLSSNFFCPFRMEKTSYDLSSKSDSFVA